MTKPVRILPPGQQLAAPGKWPIIGERQPNASHQITHLQLSGLVANPATWSLAELQAMPQASTVTDIHCVTRWSMLEVSFQGVLLQTLLDQVGPLPDARYVSFQSNSMRGHSSSLSLTDALALNTLIAMAVDGRPLPVEHGGPLRNIVPGRYFYKSVKWLMQIEIMESDRLGYWEAESGYHNRADPWAEERYIAASIDKRTAQRLIESRDFSKHDLRSIDVSQRSLVGLNAEEASLRDANFRRCDLRGANFRRANLSNAHLQEANLQQACFVNADLEGANLSGADLRGADLSGASLIGCSFFEPAAGGRSELCARLDPNSTTLPPHLMEPLAPQQIEFLRRLGFG